MSFTKILAELKRRNVYKVAIAYLLVGWAVVQGATQVFPFFEIPKWTVRLVVVLLAIGLPAALVFAWAFELTPEGLKRTEEVAPEASITRSTGRKLDFAIIAVLLGVITALLLQRNYGHGPTPVLGIPERSIALLPFENLSRDPANAYLAEGIQDEILSHLVQIADLKVISRASTHQYDSPSKNLPEIGRQLAVTNILEGSVQKAGDQVRVSVRLNKAATDAQIWAQVYDRKMNDIFALESEVARAIAESLQAKLTAPELEALAVRPTNNLEAYDAYLQGLASEATHYSSEDLSTAIHFYERAVQLDPKFGLAWARLSRADARMYFSGDDKSAARRDAAEQALNTARTLDPEAPETILAQAYFPYWVLRDYDVAKAAFTRARDVLPGNSDVPAALARITRRQGYWDESIGYWEQTLALDPRNREWLTDAAWTYSMLRQFPLALQTYARALEISPNDADLLASQAQIYQAEGDLAQAGKSLIAVNAKTGSAQAFIVKIIQLFLERHPDEAVQLLQARLTEFHDMDDFERGYDQQLLASAQQFAGDLAGARATAQQAQRTLETLCEKDPTNPNLAAALSHAYTVLGNKHSALSEAERAMRLRPSAKDAVMGPAYEENLALVEAAVGENNRAIATLERLLKVPYNSMRYGNAPLTPALLELDPTWDPLRSEARFQRLLAETPP
ncbi:MAG: hypothetical protein ABI795_01265 [Chthoniobacterales bacterium]